MEQAPGTHANDAVVWGRVTFTCIAFNVAQIAKTTQGRRLAHLGIRRLRRELTRQVGAAPVIVFARDCYGSSTLRKSSRRWVRPRLSRYGAGMPFYQIRIARRLDW